LTEKRVCVSVFFGAMFLGNFFLIKPGSLSPEELEFYKDFHFSNFIFFKEHFQEDFEDYLNRLKEVIPSPGFLAVDQEGGRVCRIPGDFASPREASIAWKKEGKQAFLKWAETIAHSLLKKGLNLNLAPCVDLGDENSPEFLKDRTFDRNPEVVVERAIAFVEIHHKLKIFTCAKHFPGLNGVEIDPHKFLPQKNKPFTEDLFPFKVLIEQGHPLIMTTHLLVKEWDNLPVTFSAKSIEILRKELNFKGLILSDDLNMGALNGWELPERLILSFASGHNMLIYCGEVENLMEVFDDVRKEIFHSTVLKEKIKESSFILEKVLHAFGLS